MNSNLYLIYRWLREVRRAASVDASNEALQHEANLIRRVLPSRPYRTLYSRYCSSSYLFIMKLIKIVNY